MQTIPLVSDVNYEFDIKLERVSYRFLVTWNSYNKFYTLGIRNLGSGVEFSGIKLVLNTELIQKFASPELPQGALLVLNTDKKKQKIEFGDFENNARLVYIPKDELRGI